MLECQKHLFDLDATQHYINGAYMSPITKATAQLGVEAVNRKLKPQNIFPIDFFTEGNNLKKHFADLIGADNPERVALIPSVSYGMGIVAKNLKAEKGQNIVVTEAQFPSNVYPWRRLAAEKALNIKTVAYPIEAAADRGKIWNERILEAIDSNTAMVTLGHIHWANGTLFDLKAISKKAKSVGAILVIDGSQSIGALPFDVAEIEPDALITVGYKWLMGAYSLGYAYFGSYFDNGAPLEETWIGRENSEDFRALVDYQDAYKPYSARYDMGERASFIAVSMGISALTQILAWGVPNIQAYAQSLTQDFVPLWREKGYWVENDAQRSHHLFGIQLPKGISMEKLQGKLQEKQILVSLRGDFMRISPNVYNDKADIEILNDVLLSQ